MAVPVITSLSPDKGSTKGRNIVVITGQNFKLPDPPPATGYVGGSAPLSVKVYFEGVASDHAEAASATEIICVVPIWKGSYKTLPETLDVKVENVDATGVLIPGETVTTANAYTISRANLADESTLQSVQREVIRLFRRHLLENTHLSMSRDYDGVPLDFDREKTSLPVCYLIGPRLPVNRFCVNNLEPSQEDPLDADRWLRMARPEVVDIEYDIVIIADKQRHLNGLSQALLLLFRDVRELEHEGDAYDFRMPFATYPRLDTKPSQSDLIKVRAGCVIKQVHVEEKDGTVIGRGWNTSEDIEPEVQKL